MSHGPSDLICVLSRLLVAISLSPFPRVYAFCYRAFGVSPRGSIARSAQLHAPLPLAPRYRAGTFLHPRLTGEVVRCILLRTQRGHARGAADERGEHCEERSVFLSTWIRVGERRNEGV